jgi:hypothetical protein
MLLNNLHIKKCMVVPLLQDHSNQRPKVRYLCFITLSTIFLLDKGSQFYWWRKPGLSGENHRPVGSELKICKYLSTAWLHRLHLATSENQNLQWIIQPDPHGGHNSRFFFSSIKFLTFWLLNHDIEVLTLSSQNSSVLSDMTSKVWSDFAKDWHKIGILKKKINEDWHFFQ